MKLTITKKHPTICTGTKKKLGKCFTNVFTEVGRGQIVQGLVVQRISGRTILHSWYIRPDGTVVDPTFDSTASNYDYIGWVIPNKEFMKRFIANGGAQPFVLTAADVCNLRLRLGKSFVSLDGLEGFDPEFMLETERLYFRECVRTGRLPKGIVEIMNPNNRYLGTAKEK